MNTHEKINYVEFPATDIAASRNFFSAAFGFSFVDYGAEYSVFSDQGPDGGFYKSDRMAATTSSKAAPSLCL